jgi:hypothetical protein
MRGESKSSKKCAKVLVALFQSSVSNKKANTLRYWLFVFIVTPIKTLIGKLFSVNF